ncbi:MAG: START-like domain-containing protein [Butyricimonas faecihominis]
MMEISSRFVGWYCEEAELVDMKKNSYVRFKWLDADDEEEFFEFSLHVEPLTEEVALIITDFVDADEEGMPLNYGINRSKCYIARLVDKVFFYLCDSFITSKVEK